MNEEILISTYWTALRQAEQTMALCREKGVEPSKELSLIYTLAAAGVLRHGAKFQVVMQRPEDTGKEKKLGFFTIRTEGETETKVPAKIVFRDPEGEDHTCGEEELRSVMHDEYDLIIFGRTAAQEIQGNPIGPIVVPELPTEEEPETEETEEITETEVEEAAEIQDEARLPVFGKDGGYSDDAFGKKMDATFYYHEHDISITQDGNTGIVHFFVYPLSIKKNEKATDIFVIAESGEVCRVGISRGIGSTVQLEFAEIPFVVRGSFADGKFHSQVNCLDAEVAKEMTAEVKEHPATKRTSTTYVQMRFLGIDLCVFPAKYRNNGSTGYAPGAIAIERNGLMELLTPTSEGPFAVTGNQGEQISVETYWVGSGDNPEFRVVAEEE